MRDIRQSISHDRLLDSLVEGFLRHAQELSRPGVDGTNRNGDGGISVESVDDRAKIESDNIPFLEHPF